MSRVRDYASHGVFVSGAVDSPGKRSCVARRCRSIRVLAEAFETGFSGDRSQWSDVGQALAGRSKGDVHFS
jgi:hypothetical protein